MGSTTTSGRLARVYLDVHTRNPYLPPGEANVRNCGWIQRACCHFEVLASTRSCLTERIAVSWSAELPAGRSRLSFLKKIRSDEGLRPRFRKSRVISSLDSGGWLCWEWLLWSQALLDGGWSSGTMMQCLGPLVGNTRKSKNWGFP